MLPRHYITRLVNQRMKPQKLSLKFISGTLVSLFLDVFYIFQMRNPHYLDTVGHRRLFTFASDDMCGVKLRKGRTYLISGLVLLIFLPKTVLLFFSLKIVFLLFQFDYEVNATLNDSTHFG